MKNWGPDQLTVVKHMGPNIVNDVSINAQHIYCNLIEAKKQEVATSSTSLL